MAYNLSLRKILSNCNNNCNNNNNNNNNNHMAQQHMQEACQPTANIHQKVMTVVFRLVNFATLKNLIIKSTTFPYRIIHKYTRTSPDGNTHNS